MTNLQTLLASILVFGMLVFFHEFGHFIIAKISDIKVLEFSLGMGPRLFKVKHGDTDYSIRAFPLGGFVKMEGEDSDSVDPRAFNNKSVYARMGVVIAGPIMNFILAIFLIAVISFFSGVATTTIDVMPGGPAEMAGLRDGDTIYAIDDTRISMWDEVVNYIGQRPNKDVNVSVKRNGDILNFSIKPEIEADTNRGVIGIKSVILKHSLGPSISSGFKRTTWMTKMMLNGLVLIFKGKAEADLVGPVGIVHLVGEAAKVGIFNLLYLAAIVSINLAVFNILPIPALDGSRLVFLLIELIRGKPVEPEKEGMVHFVGFAILMMLMIFIAYKDFIRFNLI